MCIKRGKLNLAKPFSIEVDLVLTHNAESGGVLDCSKFLSLLSR